MSKLAHSNQETMDRIEDARLEAELRGEPDEPPSKCNGMCGGKLTSQHWNEEGFCNFCGEDGNA